MTAPSHAVAQSPSRQLLPNLILPAEPNRADPGRNVMRKVSLVQLDPEDEPTGKKLELQCPAVGCQGAMTLAVEDRTENFAVTITFVARGTYVNLEPRSLGTSRIVEFGTGRTGPAFIPTRGREVVTRDAHYVISRDATMRSAKREPGVKTDSRTLTDGYVFTRKREWDAAIRMTVELVGP